MEIKILGTGCPRCHALEIAVINALTELHIKADVSRVNDIIKIMEYGVMRTPGLVINGKVAVSGRLPGNDELKKILTQN